MSNIGRAILGGLSYKAVQPYIDYGTSVICLCTMLSGNPRYANVEAAVRACGVHPDELYKIACAGTPLPEAFREALYGPGEVRS